MPFNAVLSEFAAASYLTQTRSDEKKREFPKMRQREEKPAAFLGNILYIYNFNAFTLKVLPCIKPAKSL